MCQGLSCVLFSFFFFFLVLLFVFTFFFLLGGNIGELRVRQTGGCVELVMSALYGNCR